MRTFFKNTFLAISLVFGIIFFVSILAAYISPTRAWVFVLLGFLYPYLLLINIVIMILWIGQKKIFFLFPLLLIAISWRQLHSFYQLPLCQSTKPHGGKEIKLITYNVRALNRFNWAKNLQARDKIIEFLTDKNPDIICLQEFFSYNTGDYSTNNIISRFNQHPFHYFYFTSKTTWTNYGIAFFSRFPIINKGVLCFENTHNVSSFIDVVIDSDTLRIYNNHLQSIYLLKQHYDLFDTLSFDYNEKEVEQLKNISQRFIEASIKRSIQADLVAKHVKTCPYRVILCGDFNDTPSSYTYNRMRGPLKDAFIESGTGNGNTYFGVFPSFRIDYIFHSKTIESYDLKIFKLPFSDHFPLECSFSFK